jgi:uroporphyrinogen decarboxylase
MTKRERVQATLARQPVDRTPVAFWRHVPELDHDPRRLAEAMLAFHQKWDLDLVKVMSSGVYCVEDWGCKVAWTGAPNGAKQCTIHAVRATDDWARITLLDPGAGALGRELEAVRLIATRRHDDAPVLMTVFSPFTVARKLAGDRLAEDMRQAPARVRAALEAITATLVRYARTAFEAGADGLFVATQAATPDVLGDDEFAEWDLPYLREVLEGIRHLSGFTMLHLHGRDPYFQLVADLPVHAVNWHDRRTKPTLEQARERFAGALVGGLDEWRTLREGPAAAVAAEVRDAIGQTAGVGLIVGPGCVLPLDVPDAHLAAVVEAVRLAARRR